MTSPARRNATRTAHTLSLSLLLGLSGCVSTTSVRLGTETFDAHPQEHDVPIYDAVADLPRPWVKVARIRACEELFGNVFEEMRAEARQLGADALVLIDEPCRLVGCSNRERWSALAVRWK